MKNKIHPLKSAVICAAIIGSSSVFSLSAEHKWQQGEIDVLGPTYYSSFGESLGKYSLIYDFNNSFTFDNQGFSQFTKRSYLYYPNYYYLSLEGSPRFYANDWYASQNSKDLKTSMLVTNHNDMWSTRRTTIFTPYTLSKVQLPGIKASIESRPLKTSLDLIYSRLNPQEDFFTSGTDIEGIVGIKQTSWVELVGARLKLKKLDVSGITDLFDMEMTPGFSYVGIGDKNGSSSYSSTDTLKITGCDLEGTIQGVNINGEYAVSEQKLISASTTGVAMCLKADRGFFDDALTIGGEYYKIDKEYSTVYDNPSGVGTGGFNLVDDNDDSDKWVDYNTTGQQPGWYDRINPGIKYIWPGLAGEQGWGTNATTMFNFEYDRDGDGIADWNQINLSYVADDPFLWVGEDRNNNWVVDRYEDDRLPDYTYNKDLTGNSAYAKYKLEDLITRANIDSEGDIAWLISPLQVTVGVLSENMITVPSSATKAGSLVFDYNQNLAENVKFRLQYETKQVKDTYPNDLVAYSGFGGDDPLNFKNSRYDTTTLGLDFKFLKKLTIENLYVDRLNNKLDDGILQEKAGFSSRVGYKYQFPKSVTDADPTSILEKLTLLPKYRYVTTSSRDDLTFAGGNSHSYIFQIAYKPIDGLTFNIGKDFRYARNTDPALNADQSLMAMEMQTESSMGKNYNFVLYGGYQKKESVDPTTKLKTQDEDIYFVKVYVR